MRQLIIARKDLHMSAGKLAAQVSHASMAWLSHVIRGSTRVEGDNKYTYTVEIERDIVEQWLSGIFTKTVCEAKNKSHLLKAVLLAEEQGLQEGTDFFLIKDSCLTELEPEEEDGTTLTCIGFKPLPDDLAHAISRKYHLYV